VGDPRAQRRRAHRGHPGGVSQPDRGPAPAPGRSPRAVDGELRARAADGAAGRLRNPGDGQRSDVRLPRRAAPAVVRPRRQRPCRGLGHRGPAGLRARPAERDPHHRGVVRVQVAAE
jgi:hypothetical protein